MSASNFDSRDTLWEQSVDSTLPGDDDEDATQLDVFDAYAAFDDDERWRAAARTGRTL